MMDELISIFLESGLDRKFSALQADKTELIVSLGTRFQSFSISFTYNSRAYRLKTFLTFFGHTTFTQNITNLTPLLMKPFYILYLPACRFQCFPRNEHHFNARNTLQKLFYKTFFTIMILVKNFCI